MVQDSVVGLWQRHRAHSMGLGTVDGSDGTAILLVAARFRALYVLKRAESSMVSSRPAVQPM